MYVYIYLCVCIYKSHRSKMSIIYICSQKDRQCALLVITNPPMAPWCIYSERVYIERDKCYKSISLRLHYKTPSVARVDFATLLSSRLVHMICYFTLMKAIFPPWLLSLGRLVKLVSAKTFIVKELVSSPRCTRSWHYIFDNLADGLMSAIAAKLILVLISHTWKLFYPVISLSLYNSSSVNGHCGLQICSLFNGIWLLVFA